MEKKKFILVGTGGFGEIWCQYIVPRLTEFAEMVAAVDIDPAALKNAVEFAGMKEEQCYTDAAQAIQEHPADFLILCIPYAVREPYIDLAIANHLDVLCEKPFAGDIDTAVRMYKKVKEAGIKLAVTMSHSYEIEKQTVKRLIETGNYGKTNYIMSRLTMVYQLFRENDYWAIVLGGMIHNLDTVRRLAGSNAKRVYGDAWIFDPDRDNRAQTGMMQIEFENGVRAVCEESFVNATTLNRWGNEYLRVETEKATIEADQQKVTLKSDLGYPMPKYAEIPNPDEPYWDHALIAHQFVDWLNGGKEAETSLDDSLQTSALLYACVESAKTHQAVDVQKFLKDHMK